MATTSPQVFRSPCRHVAEKFDRVARRSCRLVLPVDVVESDDHALGVRQVGVAAEVDTVCGFHPIEPC
jgi:hypothetical protein